MSEWYCECPLAGYCQRHQIQKTVREHEFCQGINCNENESAAWRLAWDEGRMPGQKGVVVTSPKRTVAIGGGTPSPAIQQVRELPGTELKRRFAWFARSGGAGCSCDNHAALMDQKGCNWCDENLNVIVDWVVSASKKFGKDIPAEPEPEPAGMITTAKNAAIRLSSGMPGFESGIRMLVSKAIKTARDNAAKNSPGERAKKFKAGALVNRGAMLNAPALLKTPIDPVKIVKHFIFHMLPLRDEHEWVWRRNVWHIRSVLHQFNGRIIVAIATHPGDEQTVNHPHGGKRLLKFSSYSEVLSAFGADVSRISFRNVTNRIQGEGVSFPLMLEEVLSDDPNHVFLYAHNKGGTHGDQPIENATHLWREAMWETVAKNPDAVTALDNHALAGSFLRHGGTGTKGKWHFSGTFFWGRCADVYARNWNYLQKHYGNVEMWPGIHFQRDEVACLFADNVGETNDTGYWTNHLLPSLSEWRDSRAITESSPSLSVIIPTVGRNSLAATLRSITSQRLIAGDQVIVVHDGDNSDDVRSMFQESGLPGCVLTTGQRSNDWGAAARALGQQHAAGDYLIWMDDDDAYTPGAFTTIRRHAILNPKSLLLLRMQRNDRSLVWGSTAAGVSNGNVSTQCLACPKQATLGAWGTAYAGDLDFIASTVNANPNRNVVWVPEVICRYGR